MISQKAKGLIEYYLEGTGQTVVVLNGGHCSRGMEQAVVVALLNLRLHLTLRQGLGWHHQPQCLSKQCEKITDD